MSLVFVRTPACFWTCPICLPSSHTCTLHCTAREFAVIVDSVHDTKSFPPTPECAWYQKKNCFLLSQKILYKIHRRRLSLSFLRVIFFFLLVKLLAILVSPGKLACYMRKFLSPLPLAHLLLHTIFLLLSFVVCGMTVYDLGRSSLTNRVLSVAQADTTAHGQGYCFSKSIVLYDKVA